MATLRDKTKAIPNGIVYRQKETGFKPPAWSSFEVQVQLVMGHRRANPHLVQRYKWLTDVNDVRREVDEFLAGVCKQKGWTKLIFDTETQSEPRVKKNLFGRLGVVASGGRTIVEWLRKGADAVSPELAAIRAGVCVNCSNNGQGGLERYFTVPVSEAIRQELNRRDLMRLRTPHDNALNVCEVCSCPLKLKVHMPLDQIKNRLAPDLQEALPSHCWIVKEGAGG